MRIVTALATLAVLTATALPAIPATAAPGRCELSVATGRAQEVRTLLYGMGKLGEVDKRYCAGVRHTLTTTLYTSVDGGAFQLVGSKTGRTSQHQDPQFDGWDAWAAVSYDCRRLGGDRHRLYATVEHHNTGRKLTSPVAEYDCPQRARQTDPPHGQHDASPGKLYRKEQAKRRPR